jgi:hypothetical protein
VIFEAVERGPATVPAQPAGPLEPAEA